MILCDGSGRRQCFGRGDDPLWLSGRLGRATRAAEGGPVGWVAVGWVGA